LLRLPIENRQSYIIFEPIISGRISPEKSIRIVPQPPYQAVWNGHRLYIFWYRDSEVLYISTERSSPPPHPFL